MTDRDTRDEIAQVIRSTLWGELGRDSEIVADNIADALIAAGLVVPSGLTAEKLREIADELEGIKDDLTVDLLQYRNAMIDDLCEWADALSTQETL